MGQMVRLEEFWGKVAARPHRGHSPQFASIDGGCRGLRPRAVVLPRQSIAKGFTNVAHMGKDTALDPLRQPADFRALVADLAKKFPPPVVLAPPPRPTR